MKYQQIGIPPEEAQFLETRKFQINEIARLYRIPPHMIGDLDKSSFSNIEQQSLEFVKYTLDPNGEPESFYADGIEYYIIVNNMGYDGDLELALIPEGFRTDVLKEEADTNEMLVENANSETAAFALLFEFDGDIRKIRYVLYNCSASRPKIEGKTNEESREVQTETLTIKARPLASGYVKAKTGDKTAAATYDGWYQNVYTPTPKTTEEGQG